MSGRSAPSHGRLNSLSTEAMAHGCRELTRHATCIIERPRQLGGPVGAIAVAKCAADMRVAEMSAHHCHPCLTETGTEIRVLVQPTDQRRQTLGIAGDQFGQRVRQRQPFGRDRRHGARQSCRESFEHLALDAGA